MLTSTGDPVSDFERVAGISSTMRAALHQSLAQMGFDLGSNAMMYAEAVKSGMDGFSKKIIWRALEIACREIEGEEAQP